MEVFCIVEVEVPCTHY